MRWLTAGLTFVSAATVAGLVLGILGHGLGPFSATASFSVGIFAALLACFKTPDDQKPFRLTNRRGNGIPPGNGLSPAVF